MELEEALKDVELVSQFSFHLGSCFVGETLEEIFIDGHNKLVVKISDQCYDYTEEFLNMLID